VGRHFGRLYHAMAPRDLDSMPIGSAMIFSLSSNNQTSLQSKLVKTPKKDLALFEWGLVKAVFLSEETKLKKKTRCCFEAQQLADLIT